MFDISKYRSALMGFSILEIMLFHCGLIPLYGYIGVEFFLFISAIGLFYSLKKDNNITQFYKRRLVRLLPAYFIFAIPTLFVFKHYIPDATVLQMLEMVFQIRTLTESQSLSFWFISLILICYLITPFFLRYKKVLLSNLSLLVIIFVCFYFARFFKAAYIIERIPVFLLSLKIAPFVYYGKKINYSIVLLPFVFVFFHVCYLYPWLQSHGIYFSKVMFSLMLCTFPLIVFFTNCISFLPKIGIQTLSLLGKYSLELYLCHEYLCLSVARYLTSNVLIYTPLSIALALVMATIVHRIVTPLQEKLLKVK